MSEQANPGDLLRGLEERLLDPRLRRSPEIVEGLLAEEFVEFGASGRVFDRAAIVAELSGEDEAEISLRDFCVRYAGAGSAVVTYTVERRDAAGAVRTSLRSSLWVWRDGRWQMLFHQGTRVGL